MIAAVRPCPRCPDDDRGQARATVKVLGCLLGSREHIALAVVRIRGQPFWFSHLGWNTTLRMPGRRDRARRRRAAGFGSRCFQVSAQVVGISRDCPVEVCGARRVAVCIVASRRDWTALDAGSADVGTFLNRLAVDSVCSIRISGIARQG